MVLSHKEFYGLIIDNLDEGTALLDNKLNPIVFNPAFEQYCRLIDGTYSKDPFSLSAKIIDLLMKFQNEWPSKGKCVSQISTSNNRDVNVVIKDIRFRSHQFYLVTIHVKGSKESNLYLALKDEYNINESEYQVILLAKKGYTNDEIAKTRGSSPSAIKMSLSRIYKKLEVANRAEMIGSLEEIVLGTME